MTNDIVLVRNDQLLDATLVDVRAKQVSSVTLNLTTAKWFKPIDLVRFKCLLHACDMQKIKTMVLPPKKAELVTYLRRMGLITSIDTVASGSGSTFFPLYRIRDDNNSWLFDELVRVFGPEKPSVNWAPDVAAALTELVDNIYYHAGATPNSGWGYVHAQKLPTANRIGIGIADVGIGYMQSYRRTGQVRGRSSQEIVRDSFNLQESSLNLPGQPPHRGIGLSFVEDFVKWFKGKMQLCTDDVSAEFTSNVPLAIRHLGYVVSGTWISLEVPIR